MAQTFDKISTRRLYTPWGAEVKAQLARRRMEQNDLVSILNERGFNVKKVHVSRLLFGQGAQARQAEIAAISEILEIPIGNQSK